jgi:hypothetical protein
LFYKTRGKLKEQGLTKQSRYFFAVWPDYAQYKTCQDSEKPHEPTPEVNSSSPPRLKDIKVALLEGRDGSLSSQSQAKQALADQLDAD